MGKLNVFNFLTLNGFYKGAQDDISWHPHDNEEENKYAAKSSGLDNVLLFGRVTYELMSNYWPTAMALENDPAVAKGINSAEKIVFSKTLKKADWNNTRIMKDNIVEEIRKLKAGSDKDMTILGSGSIVSLFAENNLIDTYQLMIDPVVIGCGDTIFKNITRPLHLKLVNSRSFESGTVLLSYEAK